MARKFSLDVLINKLAIVKIEQIKNYNRTEMAREYNITISFSSSSIQVNSALTRDQACIHINPSTIFGASLL
jgi:hypothetical protein